ncbi:TetR family transcriptional regulator [Ochrobactrum sp. MYb15]|uniref:TetR/AcrR family transcriptional regulator n=1 Tax=Brucella pituitosa TaxID=571256 RepID=UPI000CFDBB53|nr:TetR family transcriptional regulator [Ochrobactrum sp. MYb19]PRA53110.1 TetR family transcriptional regulator [Ochrobactrum sp. MYb68]PRA63372.1 TetR family transcriptional regulator [Ochrobactrum sp. MYb18]PRA73273.1 TetR family transcriptional regulator [Brucella thiophenivorans]PRA88366.1 TetR family transcriptional regulator [Ochrobactrum sp. MYb14]PRA94796.1 TetR family transcriptional regulator [Ochrobactrum sp. MYb15]
MSTRPKAAEFDQVKSRRGGRSSRVREAVMEAVRKELEIKGYNGISHRGVAAAAGVDHVTIYRRWPTRARLVVDMVLDIADGFVPVPDTGTLDGDLRAYMAHIIAMLADPAAMPLLRALFAASMEGDEDVRTSLAEIWNERFTNAYIMIDRAIERREVKPTIERERVLEALVSPIWFRTFVRRAPLDEKFMNLVIGDIKSFVHQE